MVVHKDQVDKVQALMRGGEPTHANTHFLFRGVPIQQGEV